MDGDMFKGVFASLLAIGAVIGAATVGVMFLIIKIASHLRWVQ